MPAAIPIAAAVAGSAASAVGNKLSQPKAPEMKTFDPRLPTTTQDFFTQSGAGNDFRGAFGEQLAHALQNSLAKVSGVQGRDFSFANSTAPLSQAGVGVQGGTASGINPTTGRGPMPPQGGPSVGYLMSRMRQDQGY